MPSTLGFGIPKGINEIASGESRRNSVALDGVPERDRSDRRPGFVPFRDGVNLAIRDRRVVPDAIEYVPFRDVANDPPVVKAGSRLGLTSSAVQFIRKMPYS